MKKTLRFLALALVLVFSVTAFTFASAENAIEPRVVKILHFGEETEGWSEVYQEFLNRTKDTLNIELYINWIDTGSYMDRLNLEITAGNDWDLVFDAPWGHLPQFAAEGYYKDLSEYFGNPEKYPGLAAGFTSDVMAANAWFGKMCYIPLLETYGNGIPCVWYRADWAEQWGIGVIDSYEKLEQYWQAALDNGLVGLNATNERGFFQLMTIRDEAVTGSADAGLTSFSAGGLRIWTYLKDGELAAYAVQGAGDEAFKDFPEGWQYDFGAKHFDTFQKWQEAGYIDPDSMSSNSSLFFPGMAASIIGTLDDIQLNYKQADEYGIGRENMAYFIYDEKIAAMEPGSIPTDRVANNGLCVPATSQNTDAVMEFLDWLFANQANHDLFQYGREGIDFVYGENRTFVPLTTYPNMFGGYAWTWNANYALLNNDYNEKDLAYRAWEYSEEPFVSYPILGFHFDASDIDLSTAVAQCTAVTEQIYTVMHHGIAIDGNGVTYDTITDMMKANTEQAMENGGQAILDAFVAQLTEYLASIK